LSIVITVNQRLRAFSTSSFISLYVLPVSLQSFAASDINGTHKITWNFGELERNVEVQYSSDGSNFSILKTYNTSLTGTFYNTAINTDNYYRISWQKDNGAIEYSNVIRIRNEKKNTIGNFLLKANGELTFTLNSSAAKNYKFELAGIDGRVFSQIFPRPYTPGINKVYVSKSAVLSSVLYLIVYDNNQRTTAVLHVQK
jgi:hypothetical protein